jgi:hypothetical protein
MFTTVFSVPDPAFSNLLKASKSNFFKMGRPSGIAVLDLTLSLGIPNMRRSFSIHETE